jgi:hypothetical protein
MSDEAELLDLGDDEIRRQIKDMLTPKGYGAGSFGDKKLARVANTIIRRDPHLTRAVVMEAVRKANNKLLLDRLDPKHSR